MLFIEVSFSPFSLNCDACNIEIAYIPVWRGSLAGHSLSVRDRPCASSLFKNAGEWLVKDYVGAIDQARPALASWSSDRSGRIVSVAQKEHEQIFPRPGWVEHDALEILRRTHEVIAEALEKRGLQSSDLAAIGITNQRETTVVWDRKTGRPVANALVWQDTRVADDVAYFEKNGGQNRFLRRDWLAAQHVLQRLEIALDSTQCPRRQRSAQKWRSAFRNIDTFPVWNPWAALTAASMSPTLRTRAVRSS